MHPPSPIRMAPSQAGCNPGAWPIRVQDFLVSAGVRLSRLEFSDVPASHRRWAAVQIAATREIMIGNGADTFSVDAVLTRGEAAVVLARALLSHRRHHPRVHRRGRPQGPCLPGTLVGTLEKAASDVVLLDWVFGPLSHQA
jgi:hypothetical protein